MNPIELPTEKILGQLLEANYPFQFHTSPNVPCASDFKPVFHNSVLKKRKLFLGSIGSSPPSPNSPTPSKVSKPPLNLIEVSKMTERQQIRYLMSLQSNQSDNCESLAAVEKPQELATGRELENPETAFQTFTVSALKIESHNETKYSAQQDEELLVNDKLSLATPDVGAQRGETKRHEISERHVDIWTSERDPLQISEMNCILESSPGTVTIEPTNETYAISPMKHVQTAELVLNVSLQRLHTPEQLETTEGLQTHQISSPTLSNGNSTPKNISADIDHYSTLLVRNLSYSCTVDDLEALFKQCGTIDQITIPLDKVTGKLRGYGFVKFVRREDAELAVQRYVESFVT